jgi:DNA-binding GntR family transcriptional regulator
MSSPSGSISGSLSHALLSDQVYDLIRGRLIAHEFAPGSRLVESEIARQLSVSQAPVREALRRLAHEGLVLQLPRRGSFVAELSTEEARDAYEIRAALEGLAVTGALGHLDEALLAELDGHIEEMLAAADADDLRAFVDADVRFHRSVWAASGNSLLPRVWLLVEAGMRNLTLVSNRLYFHDLTEIAHTHYPLVAGLRRRDLAVAEDFKEHALRIWRILAAEGTA